jgi:hypothetical protein
MYLHRTRQQQERYMQTIFNGVSTSYVSDYLIFNASNLTVNVDEINVCKMAMINMLLVNKYWNDIAFDVTNRHSIQ